MFKVELKELVVHTTKVAGRYGFGEEVATMVNKDTIDMFMLIGIESRGMSKKARTDIHTAKNGINKLLRSLQHRCKLAKNTNLAQNFCAKELVSLDLQLLKLSSTDVLSAGRVLTWNNALSSIQFMTEDGQLFGVRIGHTLDTEGVVDKYYWLTVALDKRGILTTTTRKTLTNNHYHLT